MRILILENAHFALGLLATRFVGVAYTFFLPPSAQESHKSVELRFACFLVHNSVARQHLYKGIRLILSGRNKILPFV